jgi:hypothetical protein
MHSRCNRWGPSWARRPMRPPASPPPRFQLSSPGAVTRATGILSKMSIRPRAGAARLLGSYPPAGRVHRGCRRGVSNCRSTMCSSCPHGATPFMTATADGDKVTADRLLPVPDCRSRKAAELQPASERKHLRKKEQHATAPLLSAAQRPAGSRSPARVFGDSPPPDRGPRSSDRRHLHEGLRERNRLSNQRPPGRGLRPGRLRPSQSFRYGRGLASSSSRARPS